MALIFPLSVDPTHSALIPAVIRTFPLTIWIIIVSKVAAHRFRIILVSKAAVHRFRIITVSIAAAHRSHTIHLRVIRVSARNILVTIRTIVAVIYQLAHQPRVLHQQLLRRPRTEVSIIQMCT